MGGRNQLRGERVWGKPSETPEQRTGLIVFRAERSARIYIGILFDELYRSIKKQCTNQFLQYAYINIHVYVCIHV